MDSQVQFIARGADCSLYLTSTEAVYVLADNEGAAVSRTRPPKSDDEPVTKHALRMKFQGASESNIAGVEQLPGVINYLKGNDPSKWRTNVPLRERRDVPLGRIATFQYYHTGAVLGPTQLAP